MNRKLSEEELEIRKSRIVGGIISAVAFILLIIYFFLKENVHGELLLYAAIIFALIGVLFLLPINYYIFDICDWEERENIKSFIKKLRLRAIVFTNLSYLILIISILVIIFSFYQLRYPGVKINQNLPPNPGLNNSELVTQAGSVIVLIFLVQILFRVFKYLIRVGGFYNGKADAIELTLLDKGKNYNNPYQLMETLTPKNYDMSDVESPNLIPGKS